MQSLHPSEIGLVVEVQVVIVLEVELNLIYDANGNLVTGDGKFRSYNSLNQLSKIYNGSSDAGTLLEELTYHPIEEKILTKKTYNSSGTVIETVIYVDENFVRVVNSSGSYDYTYVKHEGQLVGQRNPDGTKLFIHTDQEGSSTVVTNEAGTIVENTTYSPFGEILTGGNEVRYGYEGKEHDTVVGDTDFNFRKYKAEWGLFTQPDTLIQNVYDPQSLNRYAFERNNPNKNVDLDGREPVTALMIAGYVADAITFGYYSFMAYYESNPEKQRVYAAQATLTAILASNAAPYDAFAVASGMEFIRYGSRLGLFKSIFPELYKAIETYQAINSIFEASRIISTQVGHRNAYTHVANNPNLNQASKSEIQASIAHTATSGHNVDWYYNPNSGTYQYWVGEGRPSNSDYQPISGSSGSGSSSGSGKKDVTKDSRPWWKRHKYA